ALRDEPENSRSVFYLANSHFDAGHTEAALRWYRRRADMGGYEDERFISMYRIGLCFERLKDEALLYHQMLLTFDRYPTRAEPLHVIALRAQRSSNHRLAYELARLGSDLAAPKDALFVESAVYEWRLDDIMAVSLYWLGRYAEAAEINRELLETAPPAEHARISQNLEFCRQKTT
ncbi:MAG: glycosyl transferase, partial [Actinomycetota bacterium]|nr:glycosyl transferase [Actinomycetota bacterium]